MRPSSVPAAANTGPRAMPAIFVFENNQYGEYTAMTEVTAGHLVDRGTALGDGELEEAGEQRQGDD